MKMILPLCAVLAVAFAVPIPSRAEQTSSTPAPSSAFGISAKIDGWVMQETARCMDKQKLAAQAHDMSREAYAQGDSPGAILAGQREATLKQESWMCQIHAELAGLRQFLTLTELQKAK
jgi:hypothetical protein